MHIVKCCPLVIELLSNNRPNPDSGAETSLGRKNAVRDLGDGVGVQEARWACPYLATAPPRPFARDGRGRQAVRRAGRERRGPIQYALVSGLEVFLQVAADSSTVFGALGHRQRLRRDVQLLGAYALPSLWRGFSGEVSIHFKRDVGFVACDTYLCYS